MYKTVYSVEPYIKIWKINKYRQALAQFWCSSHKLGVETGRYIGERREDRHRSICKKGFTEDEYHFICVCEMYKSLRCKYIPSYYYSYPSRDKFNLLMEYQNEDIIIIFICIYHAFVLRGSISSCKQQFHVISPLMTSIM